MSELTASALCPYCGRLIRLRSRSGIFETHPEEIAPGSPACKGSERTEPRATGGAVPRAVQR